MNGEVLKKEFVPKYLSVGEDKFYRSLLVYALNKLTLLEKESYKGLSPDLELLEYHDKFMSLYRKEGEDVYLDLAKVFRKAGHKIYRVLLKKDLTSLNNKFLNLV